MPSDNNLEVDPIEALAAVGLNPIVNLDAQDIFSLMNALTLRSDEEQSHPDVVRAKRILEDVAASHSLARPCGWYKIIG